MRSLRPRAAFRPGLDVLDRRITPTNFVPSPLPPDAIIPVPAELTQWVGAPTNPTPYTGPGQMIPPNCIVVVNPNECGQADDTGGHIWYTPNVLYISSQTT